MANVNFTLNLVFKPAYFTLLETAQSIAAERGHDEAIRWVDHVLAADFDLFCSIVTDRRPQLRLIEGGR
jgi:hypothetical protein